MYLMAAANVEGEFAFPVKIAASFEANSQQLREALAGASLVADLRALVSWGAEVGVAVGPRLVCDGPHDLRNLGSWIH